MRKFASKVRQAANPQVWITLAGACSVKSVEPLRSYRWNGPNECDNRSLPAQSDGVDKVATSDYYRLVA